MKVSAFYFLSRVRPEEKLYVSQTGYWIIETIYTDSDGNKIKFIQQPLDNSSFAVDSENDYDKFTNIGGYEIYYRYTNGTYYYIWNDGKYALHIYSVQQLSDNELILIINGINKK